MGTVLKFTLVYCLGFTTGIIYASNKYDKNPNIIFDGWATDIKSIPSKIKEAATSSSSKEEEKKEDVEVVIGDVIL